MKLIQQNKKNIKEILTALKNGAVLVLATDTVYGLVCDARNNPAVEKIFEIKKRDKQKVLGIFVKNIPAAKKITVVKKKYEKFLSDNKTTSILQAKEKKLSKLVYKENTIGIRIPDYQFLNLILNKFNKPLAQTSANISGSPATTKIKEVLEQFKAEDVVIVDAGDLPETKPSQVIDLTQKHLTRIR